MKKIDVSIVLNIHDEARYFIRTIRSIEDAVRYARPFNITFELVIVLDFPDHRTVSIVEGYDYAEFDSYLILKVKHGSLGLSRNSGIEVANGEYIATADADDLLAFDYFQKLYLTAVSSSAKTLIFPEYYVGFGIESYVWRFYGPEYIAKATFFERHSYVSRVMFRKDLFEMVRYADVSLASGYAYEDWHFGCECLAAGCSIAIATGSMLFYRRRPGSLLLRADAETSRLVPKSRFFEPEIYLKLTWSELSSDREWPAPVKLFCLRDFLELPAVAEIVFAANRIDPAVSLGIVKHGHVGSNRAVPGTLARAYFELCKAVVGEQFTDVILLPFSTIGGAEKFILSTLESLGEIEAETRFLFITGQRLESPQVIDGLPSGSLIIDLHSLGISDIDQRMAGQLTFRLIQNLDGTKRIHCKGCEFTDLFLRDYGSKIDQIIVYYYFCDDASREDQILFTNGYSFDLISETSWYLDKIISDHKGILNFLGDTIGDDIQKKCYPLYARCDVAKERVSAGPRRRLLWASRLDGQKRPDLVAKIAKRLLEDGSDISIDAFGVPKALNAIQDVFNQIGNLHYRGGFSRFSELPIDAYDALVYTSSFDGLPNIILEAMAARLPVIAPNVGGITEIVDATTGLLIEDDANDDNLVARYVAAIGELYDDWNLAIQRAENAFRLIEQRHSKNAHLIRVSEIFGSSSMNSS